MPSRVLFGRGRLDAIGEAVRSLGGKRVSVVASLDQAAREVTRRLQVHPAVFPHAAMHSPVEVTEKALPLLDDFGGDCLVSIGGGSAVGLGKALALRTDLPHIAVPTTYAGSEMTDILGETKGGEKITQ